MPEHPTMEPPSIRQLNCMELSGGRVCGQARYELPGFRIDIHATHAGPRIEGGGEVHYLSSCASGRITRLLLADICGTASTFVDFSDALRSKLLRHINSMWQGRVVSQLHRQFEAFANEGGFASASVGTFFAPTRSFSMCNIGQAAPLVFRAADGRWEALHGETRSRPATPCANEGVYGMEEYRYIRTRLCKGDLVLAYGNGFSQARFADGAFAGQSELLHRLNALTDATPREQIDSLVSELQQETAAEDRTLVISEVTCKPVPVRNTLMAPLNWLRGARDRTRFDCDSPAPETP